jgi:DNA-3-methyladenine glycosylase II
VLERYGGRTPTPAELLADEPDALRAAAGLSRAKVAFLRSLAEHVVSGELELDRLHELGDDEVLAELTAVKGIGAWSAHIFLMFQLERPDVLAVGDLGVRRAVERAYRLDALPTAAELTALAEPWRPWRTAACRVLWRSLDNAPLAEPAAGA